MRRWAEEGRAKRSRVCDATLHAPLSSIFIVSLFVLVLCTRCTMIWMGTVTSMTSVPRSCASTTPQAHDCFLTEHRTKQAPTRSCSSVTPSTNVTASHLDVTQVVSVLQVHYLAVQCAQDDEPAARRLLRHDILVLKLRRDAG